MKLPANPTLVAFFLVVGCSFAQTAPAPPPATAAAAPVWSAGEIEFSGLIDGYYSKNFNNPASRNNVLRNFDVRSNQMSLNMAKLSMSRAADPVGFQLDLGFGRAWQIFHATDPSGDIMQNIPQAFVSFRPKDSGDVQIDFGKFYTSAGAELTETHLAWNYSRGFLYANGPYYHFGVRVTKPLTKSFTAGIQLVNGWNNVEDNNSGKTVGFTTAWTGSKISWFNTYYTGPEKTSLNAGWRNFYDTVINLTPTDRTNIYLNFDYGSDKRQAGGTDTWIAVGGAARFQLTKAISITPRVEYYYDRDGFITGQQQKLKSFTFTGEYKWMDGMISRLEYRRDWSDRPYFDRGNELANWKNQDTILIGFVAFFGPKR